MKTLLYEELVPFYHLLDPLEDHRGEAEEFGNVLLGASPGAKTLLELGSGAGHGAHFVKSRFEKTTLSDISVPMLERSKRLNPDCEHHRGDMRELRLGRQFDCVLIHDAICYIVTPSDLRRVMETVASHLKPEGAALLVPDCLKESFRDSYEDHAGDDEHRSLRCLTWSHDPDPSDDTHLTEFAFLLREGGEVRAVHDRHVYGLFTESLWIEAGKSAGLSLSVIRRPLPDELENSPYTDKMFVCRHVT
ncbi:MAG: class I SAM-dependent methyltransferase [Myxococcota bacterium]